MNFSIWVFSFRRSHILMAVFRSLACLCQVVVPKALLCPLCACVRLLYLWHYSLRCVPVSGYSTYGTILSDVCLCPVPTSGGGKQSINAPYVGQSGVQKPGKKRGGASSREERQGVHMSVWRCVRSTCVWNKINMAPTLTIPSSVYIVTTNITTPSLQPQVRWTWSTSPFTSLLPPFFYPFTVPLPPFCRTLTYPSSPLYHPPLLLDHPPLLDHHPPLLLNHPLLLLHYPPILLHHPHYFFTTHHYSLTTQCYSFTTHHYSLTTHYYSFTTHHYSFTTDH